MNANTLTYGDLLYIRDLLIADQSAKKEILGRVETMLGEHGEPNAESLAALEEARNWKAMPGYKSAKEAFAAVGDDDD